MSYWDGNDLVCFDCTSGRRLCVPPAVIHFLHEMRDGTTADALARRINDKRVDIRKTLRSLEAWGVVARADLERPWAWGPWMPEAAFFHFGTRDGRYPADPQEQDAALRAKAKRDPPPCATKSIVGPRLSLPAPRVSLAELAETLKARRTWRNFSADPVGLDAVATLLQLTWGVQRHGIVEGQGQVVLKTSPSGGARHPLEAYLLASNVDGIPAGAYHYDAVTHELVDLRRRVSGPLIERMLVGQDYYRDAAAVVVMAAVVARSMWKYPRSRAYRAILADAGHLGQTFCLVATALGLAPFCTMAFRETGVERLLRIDGVSECAIYVVGVGSRSQRHASRPGQISRRPR